MSFETSVGTSDADSITVMGRDLARDLMGKATLSELAFLVVQRPHAHAGGGAPVRRGARLARRSRADAHRPRRAAHPYRGARIPTGGDRGRPAGCGQRLPRCRRGHGALPRRGRRRRGGRGGARARGGPADPRARTPDPQGRGPAHAADLRDRRGDRASPARIWPGYASWPRRTRARPGRELPINGAGVAGAALADLGFPGPLLRGFALLARTAGLLGHLAEEMQSPIGMRLYREVDERAKYAPPTGE